MQLPEQTAGIEKTANGLSRDANGCYGDTPYASNSRINSPPV